MRRLVTSMILALSFMLAGAENKCEWKEKMMSERVAFLTMEMNLTPEEAQVFWPIYNQIHTEKDKAMHDVFKAYKAMDDAVKARKSEKEISKLLDAYIAAKERQSEIEKTADEKFRKVLPIEKVARLYLGVEKFRRQHIRKLHGRPDGNHKGQR